jgi:DNA-binding PadR family transcriptional regulator
VPDTTRRHSTPLRPAFYHILMALVRGDRHGLGIAEQIESASEGAVEMGPGTLYRSLADLAEAGLITSVAPPPDQDPRRKYYRITPEGTRLLGQEAARLSRLVESAKAQGILAEQG